MDEVSIQDVAFAVTSLAADDPPLGRPRRPLRVARHGQAANPFLALNPLPCPVRLFHLRDVTLDCRTMVLLSDGRRITETCYLIDDTVRQALTVDPALLIEVADPAPVLIGANSLPNNYYHWLIQALPAIDAVRRVRGGMVALQPVHHAWQQASLDLLGHHGAPHLPLGWDRQYRLPHAVYCEVLNGTAAFALNGAVRATLARLRDALPRRPGARDCLYVARTDATARHMRNEAALIERLRAMDFRIVVPGELPLAAQLQAFRDARLVVGPHGAGLSNIAVCEPGTLVYELLPAHYANACFHTLAALMELDHWADAFASTGPSTGEEASNFREWEVDVDAVVARVRELQALAWPQPQPRMAWTRALARMFG